MNLEMMRDRKQSFPKNYVFLILFVWNSDLTSLFVFRYFDTENKQFCLSLLPVGL